LAANHSAILAQQGNISAKAAGSGCHALRT
jgi:hypothetical protein